TINAGTTFIPIWEHQPIASVGDLAIAPSNPKILYVGTGENNARNSVAPGFGVYKSTDGGISWQSLGLEKTQHIGRIVVHPSNPNIVYVMVEADSVRGAKPQRLLSGLYRSTDGGKTWTWMSTIDNRPFYFSQVRVDPKNPNRIYRGAVDFQFSDDGGYSWRTGMFGNHEDYHAMWIDPTDPEHYIIGGDAGVFQPWDRGGTYCRMNNMPMRQADG